MSWWWRSSCCLNAILIGDPNCPLCATVYASDCCWRGAYLFCADLAFAQFDHCGDVFSRWAGHP